MHGKKKLQAGLLAVLFLHPGSRQATQTVIIDNLEGNKGKIYVAWYNKEDDFRKADKEVLSRVEPVDHQENVSLAFSVSPGEYAIAVFFDENGNGKLDTNLLGIPKEKYGFSNNVRPLMRAASFKESSIRVTGQASVVTIRIK